MFGCKTSYWDTRLNLYLYKDIQYIYIYKSHIDLSERMFSEKQINKYIYEYIATC